MESVGRLAGGIAHDFNNLMSVVLLHADSALEELAAGEPATNSVAAIRDAAARAIALGQRLMAVSSKQVLQPEVLDLNSVIGESHKLLGRLIGDDVQVIFSPGSRLGSVRADRGQLGQVILNLAVNSRDAMPHGGTFAIETAGVEFTEADARPNPEMQPGFYAMISVRDSGIGMSPETRARIFEPFFTTKDVGKGTGLGLSVVYGIVKQSGGFITVESEPGQGTEFRIYLPAVLDMPMVAPESDAPVSRGGSETILLVEDEQVLREKVYEILKNAGYRVLAAANGDEAVGLALRVPQAIHLLLTDVVMPGLSGPRLSERLRSFRPHTNVLYMSGYPDSGGPSLDPQLQHNFIQKPFTKEQLLRTVRGLLDSDSPGLAAVAARDLSKSEK